MFPIRGTFRVISTIPSTEGGGGGEGKIPPWENCHEKCPPWETGSKRPATAREQEKARKQTQAARRAVWEAAGVDAFHRFQCQKCVIWEFPTVGSMPLLNSDLLSPLTDKTTKGQRLQFMLLLEHSHHNLRHLSFSWAGMMRIPRPIRRT